MTARSAPPTPDTHTFPHRLLAGVGRLLGRALRASVWFMLPSHSTHTRRPQPRRYTSLPEFPAPPPTRLPFPGDLAALTTHFPVLHTDDEQGLLFLYSMLLAREGFAVITTERAAEALRLCQQVPISLVITDISKPEMSGSDLLRRLRADAGTAHIPLMFLTAHARYSDQDQMLRMGANAYYIKPLHPDDFVAAVREALTTWGNWTVLPPHYNPVWCRELAARLQSERVVRL